MAIPFNTLAGTYASYKFIQILSTDWVDMDAYKYGIIDEKGKVLRSYDELTTFKEKDSFTLFHRLVFNIKRIMQKIPLVKTKIGTLVTALYLLRETKEITMTEAQTILESMYPELKKTLLEESMAYDKTILQEGRYILTEDTYTCQGEMIPAGSIIEIDRPVLSNVKVMGRCVFVLEDASTTLVLTNDLLESENAMTAGADVTNTSQPVGVQSVMNPKRQSFAGVDVFDVEPEVWQKSMLGKPKYHRYAPYVGMDEVGLEIRDYALANPMKKIIIRNSKTGSMVYLRK